MAEPQVRTGAVTMKGKPLDLVGATLKPGDKAPAFTCVGAGMSVVKLADTTGKARLFSVVPSLDTPVCNVQTWHFSQKLAAMGDKIAAYTVSLDLPFAQARWCHDAKVENMNNLCDLHDESFGKGYGVLIKGLPIPLLTRAVFVVDPGDTVRYVEYVPEIGQEPNYVAALDALKAAAGA